MKDSIFNTYYFVKILTFLILTMLIYTNGFTAQTIRVGYFEKKPLIFTADDGRVRGFAVDALNDIAQQHEWQVNYIRSSLSQSLDKLKTGEIDLMIPVAYTKDRAQFIDYTSKQLFDSWGTVYSLQKNAFQSILDIDGKRIGQLKRSVLNKSFSNLAKDLSVTPRFVNGATYNELFDRLIAGEIDGLITDHLAHFNLKPEQRKYLHQSIMFKPFSIYAAATQGDPKGLLKPITDYLNIGENSANSAYNQHKKNWLTLTTADTPPLSIALVIVLVLILLVFLFYLLTRLPVIRRAIGLSEIIQHRVSTNILVIACLFALIIWVLDVLLHYYGMQTGNSFSEAIYPAHDPQRLMMRLVIVGIVLLCGILTSRVFTRLATQHEISQKQEEHLHTTLNSIGDAVVVTDINGIIVRMNPVAESLTAWKASEASCKPLTEIFNIVNSETGQKAQNPVEQVLAKGEIVGLANHTVLIAKDNTEYQIADSAAPIRDSQNNISGVVLVFRDVTDDYHLRAELRKNEERQDLALKGAKEGLWDWNIVDGSIHFDERYYTIAGYEHYEFEPSFETFKNRIHPDDLAATVENINKYMAAEIDVYDTEFQYLAKDGNYIWVRSRGQIVAWDDNHQPVRFVGTHTDISKQKKIEQELRESEHKFRLLFDNSADAHVIFKVDQIIDGNQACLDMLGFTDKSQLVNSHPADLSPAYQPDGRASHEKADEMTMQAFTKGSNRFEWMFQCTDGSDLLMDVLLNVITIKGETLIHGVWRDITESRRAEMQLKRANEEIRQVFEHTMVGLFRTRTNGEVILVNPAILNILKFDSLEAINEIGLPNIYENPNDRDRLMQLVSKGPVEGFESSVIRADGEVIDIIINIYPVYTEDDQLRYLEGNLSDISEVKKVERNLRTQKTYLNRIIEQSPFATWIADPQGTLQRVNPALKRVLNLSDEQLVGKYNIFQDPLVKKQGLIPLVRSVFEEDKTVHFQAEWDGNDIPTLNLKGSNSVVIEATLFPIHNSEGELTNVVCTWVDIAERNRIEKSLRITQFSFDNACIGIYRVDSDANILEVNNKAAEMLGYTKEEMASMTIFDIDSGIKEAEFRSIWQNLLEKKRIFLERTHRRKDGSEVEVEIRSNLLEYGSNKSSIAFSTDITERKRAEQEIQHNYSHLQAIFNTLPIIIWTLDTNGEFIMSEGKELKRIGLPSSQVVGQSVFELFKDNETIMKSARKALNGEMCEYETEAYGFNYHNFLTPVFDHNNQLKGVNGLSINVTEKCKAEDELRSLRNYLSNVIDSMPSSLVGVDIDGHITQWNKTVATNTGVSAENAQGQLLSDLLPWMSSELTKITKSIRSREVIHNMHRPREVDDGMCYEDVTIYPLVTNRVEGAVIRIDDVTEKVRLEEIMVQSEKMLSVGGLAAGMAHEINNPLAGMMQTAQVMSNRLGEKLHMKANQKAAIAAGTNMVAIEQFMQERGIMRMLAAINDSGRRVADIVDNMLSFARKSDATVSSHKVSEVIDKSLELAATDYDLKKQYDFKLVEIVKEYAEDLPSVPCEAAKMQQVLLNLLRNAAQAMQQANSENPCITLRTRLDDSGESVCFEVEDNGPGMDEETRKRVFEPFFTTKAVTIGTGLGLSVSYFIITENHGGRMSVESCPGEGAKFVICLPIQRG